MSLYLQCGAVRKHVTALCTIAAVLFAQTVIAAPPSITGAPATVAIPPIGNTVTINLRELGVIAGSGPLAVPPTMQILVNGQPEPTLFVGRFSNNGPGFVCVTIVNADFSPGTGQTYALQLTVSNFAGTATAGPQAVPLTNTAGPTVDPQDPIQAANCNDRNNAPVANAGPDRAVPDTDGLPTESVLLDGSASVDADVGTVLTYVWIVNDVSLPPSTSPTLLATLQPGVNAVTLEVTDDSTHPPTNNSNDTVEITVNGPQLPTANAGPDQVVNDTDGLAGELVTLTGTGNDPDGTITGFQWLLGQTVLGTGATLQARLPDGANDVTLVVTDNAGLTALDTVRILVNSLLLPTANAGPDQTVADTDRNPGELVTLSGSATDPDGTIASFQWLLGQTSLGTGATLQARLPDGVNIVTLLVTDNVGTTDTDIVQITVGVAAARAALAALPNLDPTQQKVALALDRVCRDLDSRDDSSPLNSAQQDLLQRCDGIYFNNTAANQVQALDALVADDFAVARTQTLLFANTQYASVMDRLMALRGGARGLSLAGLSIIVDGKMVPLAELQDMAKDLLGGGASADEPGGLLSDKWGMWARGNYSFGEKDADSLSPSFDADQWAMVAGVDYRLSDKSVIGLALSYGDSSVEFNPSGEGALDTQSWAASFYGSIYAAKNFYFDAIVNVANSSYDAERNITYADGIGLVNVDASGGTDGLTLSGGLSSGYDFLLGGLTVSPNLGFFYIDATIDSFTERGAGGLNLIYDEQNFKSLTGNLGARFTYAWNLPWGVLLPHLRVDYVREFEDDTNVFGVRFAADPNATSTPPILIETDNPDTSYWRLATGFSAQFKHGFSGYVEYQRLEGFEFISFQDVSFGLRMQRSF